MIKKHEDSSIGRNCFKCGKDVGSDGIVMYLYRGLHLIHKECAVEND
jgi:hypothetical protein